MSGIPKGALVVSCQARPDNPLHGADMMAAMARAAAAGGAGGIRANGGADIAAIRRVVDLPLIGIVKRESPETDVIITPDLDAATEAVTAGADIVALDATLRPRPGTTAAQLIAAVRTLGPLVMADVAAVAEGEAAAAAGATYVATTLSGYTGGAVPEDPDIDLVAALAARLDVPIVAEGRYATPEHVRAAFAAGAHAVVIGTAITDPRAITRRFLAACPPLE